MQNVGVAFADQVLILLYFWESPNPDGRVEMELVCKQIGYICYVSCLEIIFILALDELDFGETEGKGLECLSVETSHITIVDYVDREL